MRSLGILATAKAAAQALDLPLYKYIGGANAKVLPVLYEHHERVLTRRSNRHPRIYDYA